MRVFIIHNFYQHAGGEDVVFRQEVAELSKHHDVHIFTRENKRGLKGMMQFLTYPFNFFVSRKIAAAAREFKPDVVHIHNLHYAIGPWFIRPLAKMGIPIVQTLHNFRLLCPSASLFFRGSIFAASLDEDFPWTAVRLGALDGSILKTFLTGFTYWVHRKLGTWDRISRFIVLSTFAKSMFQKSSFPAPSGKFAVRPNALDAYPRQEKRTDRFLYIGRLSEEKGIAPLLAAFADLPFTIEVYGTGPLQDFVEAMSKQNGRIHYHGFQPPEVLSLAISKASALIVPSICYEGMPMTVIEAFAQGTPVLASNIGILAEMVVPLHTGMHFDPFDQSHIRATVTAWADLGSEAKKGIAENCIAAYKRHYTLEKNMDRLVAIYEEAIHTKKRQAQ